MKPIRVNGKVIIDVWQYNMLTVHDVRGYMLKDFKISLVAFSSFKDQNRKAKAKDTMLQGQGQGQGLGSQGQVS